MQVLLFLLWLVSCSSTSNQDMGLAKPLAVTTPPTPKFELLFSPKTGEELMSRILGSINQAKREIKLSLFQIKWDEALAALKAAQARGVKVNIILHEAYWKSLRKSSEVKAELLEMIKMGANVKRTQRGLQERFMIIDDRYFVHSSSSLIKNNFERNNESAVFWTEDESLSAWGNGLLREFAFIWNTSYFAFPKVKNQELVFPISNEVKSEKGGYFSSADNWQIVAKNFKSRDYKKGRTHGVVAKNIHGAKAKNKQAQRYHLTREVRDALRGAKKTIYLGTREFLGQDLVNELILAVKENVSVSIITDANEFIFDEKGSESIGSYVRKWYGLKKKNQVPSHANRPEIRVKYYSHGPSHFYSYSMNHQFLLIDYDPLTDPKAKKTKLYVGSYRFSKRSEQQDFEGFLKFKGEAFRSLYTQYFRQFEDIWYFNRSDEDKVIAESRGWFLEERNHKIPLHIKNGVTFTWSELRGLRKKMKKRYPAMFKHLDAKNRHCRYFDTRRKKFVGGACRD